MTGAFEVGDRVMASGGLGTIEYVRSAEESPYPLLRPYVVKLDRFVPGQTHIVASGDELERIEDVEVDGKGTTDNPVPPSVAGQPDNDQRGSGATAQHPQPEPPPLVDAEDELDELDELDEMIAGLVAEGMSVTFSPFESGVDVIVDPYDDDDGDAEGLSGFGPTPLAAMYIALDVEREPA